MGIGTVAAGDTINVWNGAHLTVGGVWTNASSRELKDNIQALSAEDANKALAGLSPVRYVYKNSGDEEYMGFIAEDVPDLVAMNDRKSLSPMDIVAVLTTVTKEQAAKMTKKMLRLLPCAMRSTSKTIACCRWKWPWRNYSAIKRMRFRSAHRTDPQDVPMNSDNRKTVMTTKKETVIYLSLAIALGLGSTQMQAQTGDDANMANTEAQVEATQEEDIAVIEEHQAEVVVEQEELETQMAEQQAVQAEEIVAEQQEEQAAHDTEITDELAGHKAEVAAYLKSQNLPAPK